MSGWEGVGRDGIGWKEGGEILDHLFFVFGTPRDGRQDGTLSKRHLCRHHYHYQLNSSQPCFGPCAHPIPHHIPYLLVLSEVLHSIGQSTLMHDDVVRCDRPESGTSLPKVKAR